MDGDGRTCEMERGEGSAGGTRADSGRQPCCGIQIQQTKQMVSVVRYGVNVA